MTLSRRAALAAGPLIAATLVPLTAGHAAATVAQPITDGNARFTVESPTLIRMEYASDGVFEDRPTFTAENRSMYQGVPASDVQTSVQDGYRVIRTSAVTLKYKEGSGPFTGANLSVAYTTAGRPTTVNPRFPQGTNCSYGGYRCEAENLTLSGGAAAATDHSGYAGSSFVDGFTQSGATIAWQNEDVPSAGRYAVQIRYANATGGDGRDEPRTLTLTSGGTARQITLPTTADWDTWSTVSTAITLPAGSSSASLSCRAIDSCNVNIDSVALTAAGAGYPPAEPANLGGYRRGLDGESVPVPMSDGVLSRDGWYLLDDTTSALLNGDGTVTDRPTRSGAYQDGYLFAYGHAYKQALQDLHDLTGPAPLLPREAFGAWFSDYHAFSLDDYRNSLLPAFRSHTTPLDALVADTDWKAPNQWDGWEFNPSLFPDPRALFSWAAANGLQLALNVHPSISTDDPQYDATSQTAGNMLAEGSCYGIGPCRLFDFRDPAQLAAYFDLHSSVEENAGRPVWWLDQSLGETATPITGASPDSWINAQYKAHADALGQRGYVLARIGGNGSDYGTFAEPPTGAWADHRSAVHFTGDTSPTWEMLAFEAQFTAVEGSGIGEPYVSHDIGGFTPRSANASDGKDDPDLYARWVQLGTFQPVLRLHSADGERLPWQYDAATAASAEKFLRLREALVPYTYTLAKQATATGLPIVRGLYLDYPEYDEAYDHGSEYTYGDDVLVAPVTTPGTGTVSTPVWFPPGKWTDYFTGRTYIGPGTAQVSSTLNTMPVFVRSGGIMVTRTDYVDHATQSPMGRATVDTAGGANGSFSLYEDAGDGNGYRSGQSSTTPISWEDATRILTIGPRTGGYPGAVANRVWTVRLHDQNSAPAGATVNGAAVTVSYDAATRTATVTTPSLPAGGSATVAFAPSPST
jgi:hypothetical protein